VTRSNTIGGHEQRAWDCFSTTAANAFACELAKQCGTQAPSSDADRAALFEAFCGHPEDAADLERRLERILFAWIAVRDQSRGDAVIRTARDAATAMTLMVAVNAIPAERRAALNRLPEFNPVAATLLVATIVLAARFDGAIEFDESSDRRRPTPRGVRRLCRRAEGVEGGKAILLQILQQIDPASQVTAERLDEGGELRPDDAARLRRRVRTILGAGGKRNVIGWVIAERDLRDLAPGHTLRAADLPLLIVGDDPTLFESIFIGSAHDLVAMVEEFFAATHSGGPRAASGNEGTDEAPAPQQERSVTSSTQWNVTLAPGASGVFSSASAPNSRATMRDVSIGAGATDVTPILDELKLAIDDIVEEQVRRQLKSLIDEIEREPAPASVETRTEVRGRFQTIKERAENLVLTGRSIDASEKIVSVVQRAIDWIDRFPGG